MARMRMKGGWQKHMVARKAMKRALAFLSERCSAGVCRCDSSGFMVLAGLGNFSTRAAHPAVIAGRLVSVIGLRGTLWEAGQTFNATAPARGAGVVVGLGGEECGRVVGVI
jgi:hypothetical protein